MICRTAAVCCMFWAVTCYAQTTAVRPSQIVPGTPDITVSVPPGSNNVLIGSTVVWRLDSTTTPTICTGAGAGQGPGAASCTASDSAKIVELTNAGAITATLPTLSDGSSFIIQTAAGTLTLSALASTTINGQTAIIVGPYQSAVLSARAGNWYASLSVPQPLAQTGATVLGDNMVWQTAGTGTPVTIAHVRDFDATATSSGPSVSFPITAIGSGHSIVGLFAYHDPAVNITSIVAGSNTFTTFDHAPNYGGGYSAIGFAFHGVTGSPTAITVTFSSTPANTDHYLAYGEYSGGSAAGAQHNLNSTTSSVTSLNTNSVTTLADGAWLWTAFGGPATATTPAGGWVRRLSDAATSMNTADLNQGAHGLVSATWTFPTAAALIATIISISP